MMNWYSRPLDDVRYSDGLDSMVVMVTASPVLLNRHIEVGAISGSSPEGHPPIAIDATCHSLMDHTVEGEVGISAMGC